jgi:hypothetical protein
MGSGIRIVAMVQAEKRPSVPLKPNPKLSNPEKKDAGKEDTWKTKDSK